MASSENQGLQIALIIFVILTLALGITSFMFFHNYTEAKQTSESARKEANTEKKLAEATQVEFDQLKELIGFTARDTLADIQKLVGEDMTKYAGTFPKESQKYHQAIAYQDVVLKQHEAEIEKRQLAQDKTLADFKTLQDAAQAQRDTYVKGNDTAQAQVKTRAGQLDAEIAKLGESETRNKDEVAKVIAKVNAALKERDDKVGELQAIVNQQRKSINDLIADKRQREIDSAPTFDQPDGRVVRVDPVKRLVWINLGSADGLPRRTLFNILSPNMRNIEQSKAKVEVSRIILDHLAECTIVEDSVADPILENDVIYTKAWKPGQQIHFALGGWIDLDKDGQSDREMVRQLILKAGGVIDAEVDDRGRRTGEVTFNTRYFIRGDEPKVRERDAAEAKGLKPVEAYNALVKQCSELKIEMMNVEKFLEFSGWQNPKNVVRYGSKDARTQETLSNERPPDGGRRVSQGVLGDQFKTRRPPGEGEPDASTTPRPNRTTTYTTR